MLCENIVTATALNLLAFGGVKTLRILLAVRRT
jgi:hypothetical protein